MIEEVFQTIKGSINKQYFGNSKFYYNKSATTGLYSLMVESTPSLYHLDTSAHLFARVKLSGKLQYISFLLISKQFLDLTLCNSANGGKACIYGLFRHLLYGRTIRI